MLYRRYTISPKEVLFVCSGVKLYALDIDVKIWRLYCVFSVYNYMYTTILLGLAGFHRSVKMDVYVKGFAVPVSVYLL